MYVPIKTSLTKIDPDAVIYYEGRVSLTELRKALKDAEAKIREEKPGAGEIYLNINVHAVVQRVRYQDDMEAVIDEVTLSLTDY